MLRNMIDRAMYKVDVYRWNRRLNGYWFGYVITDNREDKGFLTPFPRLMAAITSHILSDSDWQSFRQYKRDNEYLASR
jgi:hypothetical protein